MNAKKTTTPAPHAAKNPKKPVAASKPSKKPVVSKAPVSSSRRSPKPAPAKPAAAKPVTPARSKSSTASKSVPASKTKATKTVTKPVVASVARPATPKPQKKAVVTADKGKSAPKKSSGRKELMLKLLERRGGFQRASSKPAPVPKVSAPKTSSVKVNPKANTGATIDVEDFPEYKPPKKYPYKKKEVDQFKKTLETERDELIHDIEILDEIGNTQDEGGGYDHHIFSIHIAEHATDNSMLETNLAQRKLLKERLDMILESLMKLDEGKYGLCQTCGAAIGVERLLAKPFARMCIECRKRFEAQRRALAS